MMTGGFATVTGGLLGVYEGMGISISHLLTASIISAPAALLIAKVMLPTSDTESESDSLEMSKTKEHVNVIGAAVEGASEGMRLALNVGAVLIAFLAILKLIDVTLGFGCAQLGLEHEDGSPMVSLGVILGYACWPIAWLLSIPADECMGGGAIDRIETVANEFIAFDALGKLQAAETPVLSERSITVLTYALAGFSNFGRDRNPSRRHRRPGGIAKKRSCSVGIASHVRRLSGLLHDRRRRRHHALICRRKTIQD